MNQLTQLYNGTGINGTLLQEYSYHPTEERILVKKTYSANGSLKETVVYVSESFVQIINNSGTYNFTYIHANNQQVAQILPNGSTQYLLGDNKGNTVVTTNSGGGVVERTSYTPYGGVITGGVSSRFNYEGRENDATAGDTDFRFRKYNPTWSIFNQPDNKIFDTYDPQTLNRYAFEKNNPYTHTDPTGLWAAQLGGSLNIKSLNGISLFGGVVVSNSDQYGWQWGTYYGGAFTPSIGVSAEGVGDLSFSSNAQQVSDIAGPFLVVGFSMNVDAGVVAGYDYSHSYPGTPAVSVNTIHAGIGEAGEVHAGASNTIVQDRTANN